VCIDSLDLKPSTDFQKLGILKAIAQEIEGEGSNNPQVVWNEPGVGSCGGAAMQPPGASNQDLQGRHSPELQGAQSSMWRFKRVLYPASLEAWPNKWAVRIQLVALSYERRLFQRRLVS
jgi:hypothetical protein